jgi:hypothetical protein
MDAMIRTNYFMSPVERQGLKRAARKQGISEAALLRRVVDAYLGIAAQPEPIVFKNNLPR